MRLPVTLALTDSFVLKNIIIQLNGRIAAQEALTVLQVFKTSVLKATLELWKEPKIWPTAVKNAQRVMTASLAPNISCKCLVHSVLTAQMNKPTRTLVLQEHMESSYFHAA